MKSILILFVSVLLSSLKPADNKPEVFINKDKTEVTDGMYINCLTINDLSTIVNFTEDMNHYDQVKLELHRFGDDIDIVAADKTFIPSSKEFQKKHNNKPSLRFKILAEETEFEGSDLEVNTIIFSKESTVNMVFCKSHDLKHCSFYLILKGYKKTGEKTRFDEDVFDKGTDLSEKSVVFKSWK